MSEELQRNEEAPWDQAVNLLRAQSKLIAAWVPPRWAERTRRTREAIAHQTIEAVKMQLVQIDEPVTPGSVMLATLSCLQIGLRPDGANGHAFLLPFKDGDDGWKRVVLCIGYKGYVALAARSGIKQIRAELVFQGDRFEVDTLSNLDACRRYLPGPNASIAAPKTIWRYGFAYGAWLDGSFTEPIILSGQEMADRHSNTLQRPGGTKSYAKGNPVQWGRNQMVRRMFAGGSIALASDDYGGVAPAVLGAQLDAASDAGRLGEAKHIALLAAQSSDVEPDAIDKAAELLRGVRDAERTKMEVPKAAPRTPAEQLERERQARSAREFENKYPGWGSEDSDAPEETD